jgi:hypothetical protein
MILRFETEDDRRAFLDVIESEREEMRTRCRLPARRPDLVVLDSNDADNRWLRNHITDRVRIFPDVQFRVLHQETS